MRTRLHGFVLQHVVSTHELNVALCALGVRYPGLVVMMAYTPLADSQRSRAPVAFAIGLIAVTAVITKAAGGMQSSSMKSSATSLDDPRAAAAALAELPGCPSTTGKRGALIEEYRKACALRPARFAPTGGR